MMLTTTYVNDYRPLVLLLFRMFTSQSFVNLCLSSIIQIGLKTRSLHIGKILNMHKKYGLSLIDRTQNSHKTRRRHKLAIYGFSRNIFCKKHSTETHKLAMCALNCIVRSTHFWNMITLRMLWMAH
jgi:hypothetical protein